jgi:hypothetical protein
MPGSTIHEHWHPQEEVWGILEGELEVTIDGVTQQAGPGVATIVPPDARHAVRAVTDGKASVADYPCARWLDFQPIILIMFLLPSCIASGAAAYRLFSIGRSIFDIVDRLQSSDRASATAGSRAPTRLTSTHRSETHFTSSLFCRPWKLRSMQGWTTGRPHGTNRPLGMGSIG